LLPLQQHQQPVLAPHQEVFRFSGQTGNPAPAQPFAGHRLAHALRTRDFSYELVCLFGRHGRLQVGQRLADDHPGTAERPVRNELEVVTFAAPPPEDVDNVRAPPCSRLGLRLCLDRPQYGAGALERLNVGDVVQAFNPQRGPACGVLEQFDGEQQRYSSLEADTAEGLDAAHVVILAYPGRTLRARTSVGGFAS
jgi:hypothetical protein